ncbi:MAG: type II toxin-antitoxin system HicB family antitoxin [Defluviitaleaceae bacterium]|nr:type II toxin-antitoxin system HicB family antitoxin [Defluviitaleaceae bacterium]
MAKDLKYYMGLQYVSETEWDEDEKEYVIFCNDLPGCISCGKTLEDAEEEFKDAKMEWFSACLEDGYPIPEPTEVLEPTPKRILSQ